LLLHAAGIAGGYVLDDLQAILRHPVVVGDSPLWEVFVRDYWGRPVGEARWSYRPLTTLTFAIEHRITPLPWLHHVVNVLLFGLLSLLVTVLGRRWLSPRAALVAGLFFAALPVHVESVASLVGRADVLAAMACVLATLVLLPGDGRETGAKQIVAGCVLYVVGLLCKETVALFPVLLAWLLFLRHRGGAERSRLGTWAKHLAPAIAVAVVGLAYLLVRGQILTTSLPPSFMAPDNQLHGVGGVSRLLGNLAVLGRYTELTLVPVGLCADHTYADFLPPQGPFGVGAWWAWLGAVVLVLVLRDAARAWSGRSTGLGVAAFVAYLLVGQWVIDLSVILAERLMLWPSIWVVLAVAAWLVPSAARSRPVQIALVAVLVAFSWRVVDRSLDWRSSLSLYESSTRACPAAVHNRLNLANALRREGRSAEAVWHFGVAAAGRMAFPGPFAAEAFDVEWTVPVEERLSRLPDMVGADPALFWPGLHAFLIREGAHKEAAIVRSVAGERP
jgi:hypothetical protein